MMNNDEFESRPLDGTGGRMVPLRLQKFLARAGVASRRSSEDLMTAGRVTVNGEVVTELGSKVDPLCDIVAVDGRIVTLYDRPITLMLNKPKDVITTMKAQSAKAIVADLIPIDEYSGLYPLGRLDKDTTGLLLFSTDGDLGNALLHPSHHVEKTYEVHLLNKVTPEQIASLRAGVLLDDGMTQPAVVKECEGDPCHISLTIHEGRYHQIKRMLEAVGNKVVMLHRSKFGNLSLGDLESGKWRLLDEREIAELLKSAM